jgi:IS30 family transposase
VSIHDRPELINQKKQFGHWEIDVVEGKAHKAGLVTALERTSGYYQAEMMITKIDSEYGIEAQKKIFAQYPQFARKTANFVNGKKNYNHEEPHKDLQMDTYFCDPNSPGQRGSNEYHNGLIRRYIPKKTDFTTLYPRELQAIIIEINNRPRKCLNYSTPKEVFMYYLKLRKGKRVRIRIRM